jgi:hypothetical protein
MKSVRNYIAVLAFAGMFSAAHAGEWTCVGSTFIPDETSPAVAPNGPAAMTLGRLHFIGNSFGTIEARCNITNPNDAGANPGWGRLEITHNDPDGMGNMSRVIVQLMEVDKFTGNTNVITTYDSNNFNQAFLRVVPFNYAWNFVNFAYYVNVQIIRQNANVNPWLARVRLFD